MADTDTIGPLTGTWLRVASGEGYVELAPELDGNPPPRRAITSDTSAPEANVIGMPVPRGKVTSLSLAAGEELWLRGAGFVNITADNPV